MPSSPRPKPSTHGKASQKSSKQPQPAFYTEAEPKPANIPKPGTPAIQVHQEQKPAETKVHIFIFIIFVTKFISFS